MTVEWTGPGGRILSTRERDVMESLTHYKFSYTLNSVVSANSGTYTCTVNRRSTTEVSAITDIIIGTYSVAFHQSNKTSIIISYV